MHTDTMALTMNPSNPTHLPTQAEEEEYTTQIIEYFNEGLVPLPEGITLRAYLADKLNWYVQCRPACPWPLQIQSIDST
jgi:hypothetical protein